MPYLRDHMERQTAYNFILGCYSLRKRTQIHSETTQRRTETKLETTCRAPEDDVEDSSSKGLNRRMEQKVCDMSMLNWILASSP